MSNSVTVKICTGTACYVMGGANLLLLEDYLPENLKDKVTIEGTPCLGFCKLGEKGKAPFAVVNDETICEATLNGVIEKIKNVLG